MPKITKTIVDSLKASTKDQWIWDTEVPGFGVRRQPGGKKTYVARWRLHNGTQRKMVIARACDVTPDQARNLARDVFAKVAKGEDPMAERRQEPQAAKPTVEDLFQAFADSRKAKGRTSAGEVERALLKAYNNAADGLGRTSEAGSITPSDVTNYVSKAFKKGHRAGADKQRSYIHSAFEWAIKSANDYTEDERKDWGVTRNPASDVPRDKGAVRVRDRNLKVDELKKIWQGTRPNSPGFALETAAAIRIIIATGQRVQEVLRMEGAEVDLDDLLWVIPAIKTKGKTEDHDVPLTASIAADIQLLKDVHGDGPLFPNSEDEKKGIMPHQSVMQAIERWCESTGTKPFQTRDLRRTWKSRSHDAGIDRFTRDLIQQHARNDTGSKHYDRAVYLPQKREAMEKWNAWTIANLEDRPALAMAA